MCYTKKKRTNVRVAFGKTWHEKGRFGGICEIIIVRSAKESGEAEKKERKGWEVKPGKKSARTEKKRERVGREAERNRQGRKRRAKKGWEGKPGKGRAAAEI